MGDNGTKPSRLTAAKDAVGLVRDVSFLVLIVLYLLGFAYRAAYLSYFQLRVTIKDAAPAPLLLYAANALGNWVVGAAIVLAAGFAILVYQYRSRVKVGPVTGFALGLLVLYVAIIGAVHFVAGRALADASAADNVDAKTHFFFYPGRRAGYPSFLVERLCHGEGSVEEEDDNAYYIGMGTSQYGYAVYSVTKSDVASVAFDPKGKNDYKVDCASASPRVSPRSPRPRAPGNATKKAAR